MVDEMPPAGILPVGAVDPFSPLTARERLAAIVSFFETRCPDCKEHYCPDCTFRFEKMILEAAQFLAEDN